MSHATSDAGVIYPDSDGKPMSDNTIQFRWIVTVQGNLDLLFAARADVFVAGDNLIYPVRGSNTIRQAPDVYVAFGRPKGDRGSYKVWDEGDTFPQVVFEVLSPGNRAGELRRKLAFYTTYTTYGAEEYYVIDPDRGTLRGYARGPAGLDPIPDVNGWVSPRLGVRFEDDPELQLYGPDGRRFLSFVELGELANQERGRAEAETRRAEAEKRRAEAEQQRADAERERAEKFAAKLRALGLDPDEP
ncbi:Uma2 family endonuclease [bacterium]|nr:Uma2 family endonuclease [bacterium]